VGINLLDSNVAAVLQL